MQEIINTAWELNEYGIWALAVLMQYASVITFACGICVGRWTLRRELSATKLQVRILARNNSYLARVADDIIECVSSGQPMMRTEAPAEQKEAEDGNG